jgi:hypothetical protein
MSGLILGPQQPEDGIDTYFRPLVKDLNVMWYNDGVQIWDEHKHKYFQLKVILFMTVSNSPAARNLLGQRKKVGLWMSTLFQRNRLSVFERVTKSNVHGISTLHSNKTPVSEYE